MRWLYYYSGWGHGFGLLFGPFTFLFWVGIITGTVYLLKSLHKNKRLPAAVSIKPLDILKERYARGEITESEYDQIMSKLEL